MKLLMQNWNEQLERTNFDIHEECPADLFGFDVSIGAFKFDHRTLFLF